MASNSNASSNNLSNNKASLITEDEADRRIQALNASRDQRDSTPDSTDGLTAKLRALQPIDETPKRAKPTRLSSDNEFNPSNNALDHQEQKPVIPISSFSRYILPPAPKQQQLQLSRSNSITSTIADISPYNASARLQH